MWGKGVLVSPVDDHLSNTQPANKGCGGLVSQNISPSLILFGPNQSVEGGQPIGSLVLPFTRGI